MRALLLHPEDELTPAFARQKPWNAIFDLGTGGGPDHGVTCPIQQVGKPQFTDLLAIKKVFAHGLGRIVDHAGFDWWDMLCVEFYEPALKMLRLQRFVRTCSPETEFFITRAGLHSHLLRALCPGRVHVLASPISKRLREKAQRGLRLRPRQILQVLADKYDGGYNARRFMSSRPKQKSTPVVLLPSAYGNASRTALAYAEALPDIRFLLVTTRDSGRVKTLPENVSYAPLAAFTSGTLNRREIQHLLAAWRGLLADFESDANLRFLASAGCFDSVPGWLHQGLAIRDAWLEVFTSQFVVSALCADEMNWHTGLPLLIARSKELPTLACHHGALDLRYAFRATSADRFLAKGFMEWDYLVNSCGMNEEKIEIASPARHPATLTGTRKNSIILFSEPYEAFGGRCAGYYTQILPALANLARQNDCELVLKLHPFESKRERTRLVADLLSGDMLRLIRVADGPLNDELMRRAWFGVTVTSSVVIDCALQAIPVFLCRWLDFSVTGYAEQFIRFGAAKEISSADKIEEIPGMLRNFAPPDVKNLWQTVDSERLRELILERTKTHHPYEPSIAERAWA